MPCYYFEGVSVSNGTADVIIFDPVTGTLYVLDYKNGMLFVNEVENYQTLLYAIGAVRHFKSKYAIKRIITGILQPRVTFMGHQPFRLWELTAKELMRKWDPFFRDAVETIMKGRALTAGEEQCHWCNARGDCETQASTALEQSHSAFEPISKNTLAEVESNVLIDPNKLTDEQQIAVMESYPFVMGWLKAVRDHVERRFANHDPLDRFKMVNGRSSRRWVNNKDDESMLKMFSKIMNIQKPKLMKSELKSPAQFEKSVKVLLTKEQWAKIEALIIKTPGKPTIVPMSDRRKAIALEAKDVFQVIKAPADIDMSFLD